MRRVIFSLFFFFMCVVGVVFFSQRPVAHEISPDVKFGLLPADSQIMYETLKSLGIDYVMISNFSEEDVAKRLYEAKRVGLKVYMSAGTLHPEDYKRMKSFGKDDAVVGFFLDEPHLHTFNYSNTDIDAWIAWSNKEFPGKKIFIATPRKNTYNALFGISNLNSVGFQPDTYPIMGIFKEYGTARRLVEEMIADGFEVQPIIQTHALAPYESAEKQRFIRLFAKFGGHGLVDWPTPKQVMTQIQNVAVPGVKLIWFYPGEDVFIHWTPERVEYIKAIFQEITSNAR